MRLFSRAFDGIAVSLPTSLDASEALARLAALKRWAPGKPLLTGQIGPERIVLAFAPGNGHGHAFSRFEGVLAPTGEGCELRGRFVSAARVRTMAALFLVACGFMAFGGLITGLGELGLGSAPLAQVGLHLLAVVGWLAGVALFAAVALWNAAPSAGEVRDLTKHLVEALGAAPREPA